MSVPTPYFEIGGVAIFHGDYRDVLPALPCVFDLALVDPPYGDTSLEWDVLDLSWIKLLPPVLRSSGSLWCFGSLRMFFASAAQIEGLGWKLAQDVVWEKHNGSGFANDRFKRVHELAVQFYRGAWADIYKSPVHTNDATERRVRRKHRPPHMGDIAGSTYESHDGGPRLMRSVIPVRSCHGHAVHPTQKPLGILVPLIEYSCPVGGTLLDPTMGSGSALVAVRQLGRNAVGIEIDERCCEIAAKRLQQTLDLFPATPPPLSH